MIVIVSIVSWRDGGAAWSWRDCGVVAVVPWLWRGRGVVMSWSCRSHSRVMSCLDRGGSCHGRVAVVVVYWSCYGRVMVVAWTA